MWSFSLDLKYEKDGSYTLGLTIKKAMEKLHNATQL